MWVAFTLQKLLTFFFSKKIQHIYESHNVNFNESLTNDIVSFEQLGPDFFLGVCKNKIHFGYLENALGLCSPCFWKCYENNYASTNT